MQFCYPRQASSVSRLTSPRFLDLKTERIHSRYSPRRYQKWPKRVLRKERLLRFPIFQHGFIAEIKIWNQRMCWWGWQSISGRFCLSLILSFSASYQIYAVKNGTPSENQLAVLRQWWDAYPAAKSSPTSITSEELIHNPSIVREFAVIDMHQKDYAVSIDIFLFRLYTKYCCSWHFQGRTHTRKLQLGCTGFSRQPTIFLSQVPQHVIFYFNSSKGRGSRWVGW